MLAPQRPKTIEEQQKEIDELQMKYQQYVRQGRELIQYDECVFAPNQYNKVHWVPIK